ncbi:putative mitochondrial hypothetical protein [Leptomonas pyrrhocoris]|uniref:Uncharacterized protein n=1 Tax=Leptomonas pyrrhocoris TaxID=157538 RepID=A0A0M9G2D8_LEPPY|nr:putative mitochondrial hypothetical protein [Leptomonas pyrrhocoris]KPA80756.1 putative mitochondrial hypothetical protein [Leptomonas pyrrhocoris]|eukprot:XP_015659195.1 putative mitochondrial hypothetical protein [Leptomonas pyrrhocoris]
MLRWTRRTLTAAAVAGLEMVAAGDAAKQEASLRSLLQRHDEGVARNTKRTITVTNTYDTTAALFFDHYKLAVLPSVSGGAARQPLRAQLLESGAVAGVQRCVVAPWLREGERRVAVFGCRSVHYLRRQLRTDTAHAYLVVDSSLRDLTEAAAALTPEFGHRVYFLRCESMFACLAVLQPETVDVALVPMPVPFWSRQGSHRRLVHFDFYCAVHRALRVREASTDPRGVVLFTDCEPYAAFMMEHLEEARLIVPYTRKNPQDIFRRWLPCDAVVTLEGKGDRRRREFPQQRESAVVALAAAKSGPTTAEACQLLSAYDYARKHYRDLATEGAAS